MSTVTHAECEAKSTKIYEHIGRRVKWTVFISAAGLAAATIAGAYGYANKADNAASTADTKTQILGVQVSEIKEDVRELKSGQQTILEEIRKGNGGH